MAFTITVSDAELDLMLQLAAEPSEQGRASEAAALLRLVAQVEAANRPPVLVEHELTTEDAAALERSDTEAALGKVVPHEIVKQGHAAVDAYIHRRDAGAVDPHTAAAVEAYRRDREQRLRTNGANA